jgi:hypothetical protein
MYVLAIDVCFANVVHLLRVESNAVQFAIQGQDGTGDEWDGLRL